MGNKNGSATKRNSNPADGRPLVDIDLKYLRDGLYFLGGIAAFSVQASEEKLHSAFRQMLVTVPLLRTRVVGDPEGSPTFQAIKDPNEWPKLQILEPKATTSTTWTDFNIFDALKNILPEGLIPN